MQGNSKEHLSKELQHFFAERKLKPTRTAGADCKQTNESAPPDAQISENVPVRSSCEKAFRGLYNAKIPPQCSSTGFISESSVVEEKAGCSKLIKINMSDNTVRNVNHHFNQPGSIIYNVNGHEQVVKKREPINNVTLPINTFTGREKQLETIKRFFQIDKYKVVALVGMGGLGKSQLARAFVKENETEYNDRYWVDAETTEQLLASFDRLARKLEVEPEHDAETVHETYRSFKDGPALIIFDNVPDVTTVYKYLPTRIDLSDTTVHVLVTSRWREWKSDQETISLELEPLGMEVCLELVRKLLGDYIYEQEVEDTWMDLIEILQQLPLALQLSALYIKTQYKFNTKFRINDYVNQFRSKTKEMYNKLLMKTIPEYEVYRPVFVSIAMTLALLEKMHSELVVKVVNTSAYFNPERIFIEDLQSIIEEDDDLAEILADIVNYSLFNQEDKKSGIYSMHRLIQTSIQIYQKENNTDREYYVLALKSVLVNSKSEQITVFQYANDFEDIILQIYRTSEHELLSFLMDKRCYNVLTILFNNCKDNVISNIYSNELIYSVTVRQDVGMLDFLRNSGVDLNVPIYNGSSLIEIACKNEYKNILQYLFENKISTEKDDTGKTLLHCAIAYAVKYRATKIVPFIIAANREVLDEIDNEGRSALHIAILSNSYETLDQPVEIVRILIDNGASVLIKDREGQTPLHYAVKYGATEVIPLIIAANREVLDENDNQGRSALHIVIFKSLHQTVEILRILINNGASVLTKDRKGQTPLHYAAIYGDPEVIPLIIAANRKVVDVIDNKGHSVLHFAIYSISYEFGYQIVEIVRNLVDNGASVLVKDREGKTPLLYAAKYVFPDVIPLIIQSNREVVHEVDKMGNTALHVLATKWHNYYNSYEMLQVQRIIHTLIENGLSIHTKNKSKLTPVHTIDSHYQYVLNKIADDIIKSIPKKKSIFTRLLNKMD